ncbi:hypothetical protein ACOSQ3_001306 [Xanthoceras sorbifolium]
MGLEVPGVFKISDQVVVCVIFCGVFSLLRLFFVFSHLLFSPLLFLALNYSRGAGDSFWKVKFSFYGSTEGGLETRPWLSYNTLSLVILMMFLCLYVGSMHGN